MQPNSNSNLILISTLIAFTCFACKHEIINPSAAFTATTESSGSPASNTAYAHIAASEKLIIPAAVEVPSNLPGGNTRVATFYAVGVQKYKAREKAGSNPLAYEWMFVAPQADLYDTNIHS